MYKEISERISEIIDQIIQEEGLQDIDKEQILNQILNGYYTIIDFDSRDLPHDELYNRIWKILKLESTFGLLRTLSPKDQKDFEEIAEGKPMGNISEIAREVEKLTKYEGVQSVEVVYSKEFPEENSFIIEVDNDAFCGLFDLKLEKFWDYYRMTLEKDNVAFTTKLSCKQNYNSHSLSKKGGDENE
jgi:hypothetical protein